MKNRFYKVVLSFALLLCMATACVDDPSIGSLVPTFYSTSYISAFRDSVTQIVLNGMSGTDNPEIKGETFALGFSGGTYCNAEHNSDRYRELLTAYGDTAFNAYNTYSPVVYAEAIRSISVISDQDFDEQHPAGSPLDDIVGLSAESAYSFISSHYEGKALYPPSDAEFVGYLDILNNVPLNQLTTDRLSLLEINDMYVVFLKSSVCKKHNITMTVTFTSGKVLTGNWNVTMQ